MEEVFYTCTVEGSNPGKHKHPLWTDAVKEAERLVSVHGKKVTLTKHAVKTFAEVTPRAVPVDIKYL